MHEFFCLKIMLYNIRLIVGMTVNFFCALPTRLPFIDIFP